MFDEIIANQFLQSFANPLLTLFFRAATLFGNPGVWFLIAAWLFWLGKEKKSFAVASILLFAGFFVGVLKWVIARPRPEGVLILDNPVDYSMPSGHSTLAGAYSAYASLSKTISENLKAIIAVLAILTAVSRIYLGVHFLSDVIAGLFIGAVIGFVVQKTEKKLGEMKFHASRLQEEFAVVTIFFIAVVGGLFVRNEYNFAYAVLGYFLGYALYKNSPLCALGAEKKKQSIGMIAAGTVIFSLLCTIALMFQNAASQALFFLAGAFVTFLWPAVDFEFKKNKKKVARKASLKRKRKAKKKKNRK